MVLGSTTSPPVVAAVEIRKRPHNAKPQPPQTEDLIFSPANAEISGVITTLVCVRNDARAAGLNSNPAVTRPYFAMQNNGNVYESWYTYISRWPCIRHNIKQHIILIPEHQSSIMPTPKRSSTLV